MSTVPLELASRARRNKRARAVSGDVGVSLFVERRFSWQVQHVVKLLRWEKFLGIGGCKDLDGFMAKSCWDHVRILGRRNVRRIWEDVGLLLFVGGATFGEVAVARFMAA